MKTPLLKSLLLAISIPLFAQLTYTQYTTADGLCDNHLRNIALDSTGNIWVGGWPQFISYPGGISCFDKEQNTWTSWWPWTTDWQLSEQNINDIEVEADNTIWVTTGFNPWTSSDPADTNKILCFYRDGEWNRFDHRYGLPGFWFEDIAFDSSGNMWLASQMLGVLYYNGSDWRHIETTTSAISIAVDHENVVWFTKAGGGFPTLCRFRDDIITEYIIDSSLTNDIFVEIAPDNKVWLLSIETGIYIFDHTTLAHYNTDDGLVDNRCGHVAFDRDGLAWITTYSGLSVFDGSRFTTIDSTFGIPADISESIMYGIVIDRDDTKWISMPNNGVIAIRGTISGVSETQQVTQDDIKVFPNPFNSTCHIEAPSDAIVTIYNVNGNIVNVLARGDNVFNPKEDIPSGLYLVQIKDKDGIMYKKINYLK